MLREKSQVVRLDEMYKTGVEKGVVSYYKSKGLHAQRTENEFWKVCLHWFLEEVFDTPDYGLVTSLTE